MSGVARAVPTRVIGRADGSRRNLFSAGVVRPPATAAPAAPSHTWSIVKADRGGRIPVQPLLRWCDATYWRFEPWSVGLRLTPSTLKTSAVLDSAGRLTLSAGHRHLLGIALSAQRRQILICSRPSAGQALLLPLAWLEEQLAPRVDTVP